MSFFLKNLFLFFVFIFIAFCNVHYVLSEEISKDFLLNALKEQRKPFHKGLYIKYHVDQVILSKDSPFDFVHMGNEKLAPNFGKYWQAEHAWLGNKYFARVTLRNDFVDDPELTARINNGGRRYILTRQMGKDERLVVYQGKSLSKNNTHALPEEELYKEVIGQESLRQDIGTTFRGYKNPLPYDLLQVLQDEQSQVHFDKDTSLVVIEFGNLDRIWLDPKYGYAVVQRERKWKPGGLLRAIIKNSNFKNMEGQLWLPLTSNIKYYSNPKYAKHQNTVDATLTVDELSLSPPENLFEPNLEAGAKVVDLEHDVVGRMPPLDQKSLDQYLDNPSVTEQLTQPRSSPYIKIILIILGVALLIVGIVIKLFKKKEN